MARVAGRSGHIYVQQNAADAAPLAYVNKWALNASVDRFDVSAFGDTVTQYVAGLAAASGTFSGFLDDTATTGSQYLFSLTAAGVARKVYLYPTTPSTSGPYFFGTAFIDVNYSVDVTGANTIDGSFSAASAFSKIG